MCSLSVHTTLTGRHRKNAPLKTEMQELSLRGDINFRDDARGNKTTLAVKCSTG